MQCFASGNQTKKEKKWGRNQSPRNTADSQYWCINPIQMHLEHLRVYVFYIKDTVRRERVYPHLYGTATEIPTKMIDFMIYYIPITPYISSMPHLHKIFYYLAYKSIEIYMQTFRLFSSPYSLGTFLYHSFASQNLFRPNEAMKNLLN